MTKPKSNPSPIKIHMSSTDSSKNGKPASGTLSLAMSRALLPRPLQPEPSCGAGPLAPPKRNCQNISSISPRTFCPSFVGSTVIWELRILFAIVKTKSKSSSKPTGVPSNPSATLPVPTSKPPWLPSKLPPFHFSQPPPFQAALFVHAASTASESPRCNFCRFRRCQFRHQKFHDGAG